MPKFPRPQKSTTYHDKPQEQQLAEAIGCLILRSGLQATTVTPAERQALYDLFPGGFGLVVLAQDDGNVQMTLTSKDREQVLQTMVDKLAEGDGTLRPDEVPSMFYADKEGPRD